MADIKWLVGLDRGKQIVAILLIAVASLWGSGKYYEKKYSNDIQKKDAKIEFLNYTIIKRTDSFNIIKADDSRDCEEKYQHYLENELKKIEKNRIENEKLIRLTNKLIKNK